MVIHTTVGIYPNGEHKANGVPETNLAHHVKYNKLNRPGRLLLVDGKCVYKGIGFSDDEIRSYEKQFISKTRTVDTQPYR